IAVIFVGLVALLLLSYLLLRHIRKSRPQPPGFLPESLKKRWRTWAPGIYTNPPSTARLPSTRSARRTRQQHQQATGGAGVDRNTSVRSVMTLPEYRPIAAADRERTIGREGERGGIDVVIEFPETQDEEESRREEHMQTLYEIRLARQLERAAARESGDITAAARRPGSTSSSSVRMVSPDPPVNAATLMAVLASITERERRLSKVQYAEIGVARHDGTRVRPSMDSDRPLLDSSAPMGTSGGSVRSGYQTHGRTESGLTLVSDTGTPERRGSDEIIRMGSAPSTDAQNPRPQSEESLLPPPPFPSDPPPASEYDGSEWGPPPCYTSPVETRNLGAEGLPVLRIDTGTPSPGVSRTPSPQPQPQEQQEDQQHNR
ncbi:hypothetical protein BDD12DRAFT_758467, partial [Trichophaea hybrida]